MIITKSMLDLGIRFSVDINTWTQYATIYRCDIEWNGKTQSFDELNERPVATLQRRRVIESGPAWRMYDLAGIEIADGFIGPHTAMIKLKRIAFALAATQDDEVAA